MPAPFFALHTARFQVTMSSRFATAYAPASIGNLAVGFDVLGQSFPVLGDRARAERSPARGVRITALTGLADGVPWDPEANTASRAVRSLLDAAPTEFGVDLELEKGIPLGAGLGGSGASAVAAVVAANELLDRPFPRTELLTHALAGEAVASGSRHADNVAASLFGGLVAVVGADPLRVRRIPVPPSVRCVVVHPGVFLATRAARQILRDEVSLADATRQLGNLAGFIAGCYANDVGLIRDCLEDVLIEPQRASLIPGFAAVKAAALAAGALGSSISGAGPSIFAWCDEEHAVATGAAMVTAFADRGLEAVCYVSPVGLDEGARIQDRG
jgi:homoserine kinase